MIKLDDLPKTLAQKITHFTPVSGGDTHHTYRLHTKTGSDYFLKWSPKQAPMLEAESHGLHALAEVIPSGVHLPCDQGPNYLLFPWIHQGRNTEQSMRAAGKLLALLHQKPQRTLGFAHDNFIGLNPQKNTPCLTLPERHSAAEYHRAWSRFYGSQRLGFQIQLLQQSGRPSLGLPKLVETLNRKLETLLTTDDTAPSLLHGDLWAGNLMIQAGGQPLLIDPAVSHGHRELDLAMTTLFGGFGQSFYDSYEEVFPLTPGYKDREPIYQLYHILNHYVLFGGHYGRQAVSILKRY